MKKKSDMPQLCYDILDTFLGPLLLIQSADGIRKIHFLNKAENEPAIIKKYLKEEPCDRSALILKPAELELREYLDGKRIDFSLSLDTRGSSFQKTVWKALSAIPYGTTRSYQEIARQIGKPQASRAVGLACRQNPVAIIIPCHRVIGKNGKLTGYAGGLKIKEQLLGLEQKGVVC